MGHPRWQTNLDALLNDGFDLVLLHLVVERKTKDLLVLNVVEVLGVVLEDGGV